MSSRKANKQLMLKRIIFGLCIVFCLETGSIIYFFTVGRGEYQRNLDLGNKYLLNMDYDGAITAFSKVIEIDGMNADAYIGRGDAYKAKGDYVSAWADYEKAQEFSGNTDVLRDRIGVTEVNVVSEDGEGVDGATVKLTGDTRSYELTTDSSGFVSEILYPEKYHVEIMKEEYESFSTELSAENGGVVVQRYEIQTEQKAVDYYQIYLDYARNLQRESSEKLFMTIFESDEPVLIIADDCRDRGEGYTNIVCDIYQYAVSEERIVYIGKFSSDGTARPLRWRGKSIQGGRIHGAMSLSAKDGIG